MTAGKQPITHDIPQKDARKIYFFIISHRHNTSYFFVVLDLRQLQKHHIKRLRSIVVKTEQFMCDRLYTFSHFWVTQASGVSQTLKIHRHKISLKLQLNLKLSISLKRVTGRNIIGEGVNITHRLGKTKAIK